MSIKRHLLATTCAYLLFSVLSATAQDRGAEQAPAPASTQKPAPAPTPSPSPAQPIAQLRVQFVVTKYLGEKKISSLPYSLAVAATGRDTRLDTGAQVPIPAGPAGKPEQQSYNYRQIGTTISCSARPGVDNQFVLTVLVRDSSLQVPNSQAAAIAPAPIVAVPALKNFSTENSLALKDGQTIQLTSAPDPLTGEVMRVDVTLTVVK